MSGEKFRLRKPSFMMENANVPEALKYKAWQEAIEWVRRIDWKRVHSFRLQVNFISQKERR